MSELSEYVKISTTTQGDCLIEVLASTVDLAAVTYKQTVERLQEDGFTVAKPHNDIKASNENTKFLPQVTVTGRGESVVEDYIKELRKMETAGVK